MSDQTRASVLSNEAFIAQFVMCMRDERKVRFEMRDGADVIGIPRDLYRSLNVEGGLRFGVRHNMRVSHFDFDDILGLDFTGEGLDD